MVTLPRSLLIHGVILWGFLALAVPVASDSEPPRNVLSEQIAGSSEELSSLRQSIGEHRQQLTALADQEHAAAERLEHLVEEMGLIKNLLAGLDKREKILLEQSEDLEVRLARHEDDYVQRHDDLARRLRALYVRGRHRHLELILTAESFSSLITRLKFATTMARLDGTFMGRTRQQRQQILTDQQQHREALAGIWEAREEASQERGRLEVVDEERRAVLAELQLQKQETETELVRLQQSERRLTDLLTDLERLRESQGDRGDEESAFARLAGSLDWPVAGEIVRGFGRSVHPEFKTVTLNNGINIAVQPGVPVYSVAAGRVEFADHLPGFGVCVILDHGAGYYSLYAHLEAVFVSEDGQVSRGEIIAEVSEASGEEGSQLYFEIRRGKTPLDPVEWLKPSR